MYEFKKHLLTEILYLMTLIFKSINFNFVFKLEYCFIIHFCKQVYYDKWPV